MKRTTTLIALITLFSISLFSQGLLLGSGTSGIGFGDIPRVDGFRFNWTDDYLEEVNGFNVTLWKPEFERPTGTVNGFALGLVGPAAARLNGIAVTPGVVVTRESMSGIHVGGVALVSRGTITGLNVGGLATVGQGDITGVSTSLLAVVSQGNIRGISIGGLAAVAQGSNTGISLSGLATVAQGDLSGVSVGGLASVAQGDMKGIHVAGLATVAQGDVTGISIAGLAVVAQGSIHGLSTSGLAVVSQNDIAGVNIAPAAIVAGGDLKGISVTLGTLESGGDMTGLNIGGYKIGSDVMRGLNLGVVWTENDRAMGLTVSGYNRSYMKQTGIVIGLVNHAGDLFGLQLGLLNIVESGPSWARYVPFVNLRL